MSAESTTYLNMYMVVSARNLPLLKVLVSIRPSLERLMTINESEDEKPQIQETGVDPSPHIKEVWFPGTHSDMSVNIYHYF